MTQNSLLCVHERWWRMLILFVYPENVQTVNFCLVYLCIHVCYFPVCAYTFVLLHLLYTHSHCFFSTGYGECLLDEPVGRTYELPTLLPGQIYNANRQCELMFGPGSQICPYMVSWLAIKVSKATLNKWKIKTSGGSWSDTAVICPDVQKNFVSMNPQTFKQSSYTYRPTGINGWSVYCVLCSLW